eukprot:CCRYP_020619-RA/>CCRYP_020619-RA protein AED:0.45 eAED:0.54 QI:0/0/0/1/0/0/2/0/207
MIQTIQGRESYAILNDFNVFISFMKRGNLFLVDRRLKLLRWMGSKLAEHVDMPALYNLEQMPLRLAKIPTNYSIGGDKGFTGIEHYMPNCNNMDTPPGVVNSKKERLSKEQIEAEIPVTTVRGACETVLKHIVNEESLREKIPYWLICWLPRAHNLAHGETNLCQPLREIGSHSIVGTDYWQNQVEYTRICQMNIPSQTVEISTKPA